MHVLRRLPPSPEQIGVIRRIQRGVSLVRGAAGSGKTTTALLALRAATGAAVNQFKVDGLLPVNVLVLTYNKSLRSYISTIAQVELEDYADDVRLYVSTFDKWALDSLGWSHVKDVEEAKDCLHRLSSAFPRNTAFIVDEVEYLLGRFLPHQLSKYTSSERTGRGISPAMPNTVRQRLLDEVVNPYLAWKLSVGAKDFNDLSAAMIEREPDFRYDVIVVDEAQDFSTNQLRAVIRHAAVDATIAIVTDSTQRIYPRGTTWSEAGINIAPNRSFRLRVNYRNTRQIAALAASLAQGLSIDDDGSLPEAASCSRDGPLAKLVKGRFRQQLAYALAHVSTIDLTRETVGFLHLKGGGWFDEVRKSLTSAGLDFCELQGAETWPENTANVGLSTLHSAKGLEFDHVVMIGLAEAHVSYGDEPDDDRYEAHRRLVAMGVGRARKTVILGTKPGESLPILDTIDRSVVDEVVL